MIRLILVNFCFLLLPSLIKSESRPVNLLMLSTDFVNALKENKETKDFENVLAALPMEQLTGQIATDQQKLTFWINIYNAYILTILNKNPDLYQNRSTFFKTKQIKIAGQLFSFADIEHGILRRSQHEYFLGYFSRLFPSKVEKSLRVKKVDWRIHFALNCGAKSCPPVLAYHIDQIESQLNNSTKKYLNKTTLYEPIEKRATVTALFSWFRGDFGGTSGIRTILKDQKLIPNMNVSLITAPYDWSLDLDNFEN